MFSFGSLAAGYFWCFLSLTYMDMWAPTAGPSWVRNSTFPEPSVFFRRDTFLKNFFSWWDISSSWRTGYYPALRYKRADNSWPVPFTAHESDSMLRTYLVCREKQANGTWEKHTVYWQQRSCYLNIWIVTEAKQCHCATENHWPKSAVRPIFTSFLPAWTRHENGWLITLSTRGQSRWARWHNLSLGTIHEPGTQ
jgi:hypothetical protein